MLSMQVYSGLFVDLVWNDPDYIVNLSLTFSLPVP